jgi:hypothetical protein
VTETAALRTGEFRTAEFRSIGDLAVRCGHYCWLENQLFALTGRWASAPAPNSPEPNTLATAPGQAIDPEIRVLCSQMSSWHGFLARQWRDRLPVRAGVDAGALVVPPPGGAGGAIELLGAEPDVLIALGGLVEPFLPTLLAAYDNDDAHAPPVSELPVLAVLELARHRAPREIEAGRDLLDRGVGAGEVAQKVAELRDRLQRALGVNGGIFPAAQAS